MFNSRPISHTPQLHPTGLFRCTARWASILLTLAAGWATGTASAQSTSQGRYFPLDQTAPPGVAGEWSGYRPGFVPVVQPVRVQVAGQGGTVWYFEGPDARPVGCAAPALLGLRVGMLYRLKISGLADYPGLELYPTVELIDRLHAPCGRELEFPVPIILTADEIESALAGRLVTKVMYLEQPDRAAPIRNRTAARTQAIQPRENILALADQAGRPMAIIRLGGRVPDEGALELGFYGSGAPVQVFETPSPDREARRR